MLEQAIETKARFVDPIPAERVCFVQREELPLSADDVAEAGNRIAPDMSALLVFVVEAVVAMQPVVFAQDVTDVRPTDRC